MVPAEQPEENTIAASTVRPATDFARRILPPILVVAHTAAACNASPKAGQRLHLINRARHNPQQPMAFEAEVSKRSSTETCSYNAAAPLTISMISLVMAAWRARFINRVSESIISPALLVAESMAVIRAACSAATDSSMAR